MKRLKNWWESKTNPSSWPDTIMKDSVPEHVAIIMDGNGRWAKGRGLPRIAGHHSGMKNVRTITMAADRIGVKVLTLYAFSTENWKRPKEEVNFIMSLPHEFFPKMIGELEQKNVQVRMMGYPDGIPEDTLATIEKAIERTHHNNGLILNFALNYGGRKELLTAMKKVMEEHAAGRLDIDEMNETSFHRYLLSASLPDPDLLIRTSGEVRISNFMLWQLAYSELWFTDVYWPDFTEKTFYQAISEFQKRARRYGGV